MSPQTTIERGFLSHSFHFCKAILKDCGVDRIISTCRKLVDRNITRPLRSAATFIQIKWSETSSNPTIDPNILHTFEEFEQSKWLSTKNLTKDEQYGHDLGTWPVPRERETVNLSKETSKLAPLVSAGSEELFPIKQKTVRPYYHGASQKRNLIDKCQYVVELKKEMPFAQEVSASA